MSRWSDITQVAIVTTASPTKDEKRTKPANCHRIPSRIFISVGPPCWRSLVVSLMMVIVWVIPREKKFG